MGKEQEYLLLKEKRLMPVDGIRVPKTGYWQGRQLSAHKINSWGQVKVLLNPDQSGCAGSRRNKPCVS
ncbi:MAG: hypothetical protein IJX71_05680 [Oscillospiraceae bacterium]|nr:hypothetical protein [Oscillospiraceae bacterium]